MLKSYKKPILGFIIWSLIIITIAIPIDACSGKTEKKKGIKKNDEKASSAATSVPEETTETKKEKTLGVWINNGPCRAVGNETSCGPGFQHQQRTCTNGATEQCTDQDREQTIHCKDAGTALPDCVKDLGQWTNYGGCISDQKTCGTGIQKQFRTCIIKPESQQSNLLMKLKCIESDTNRTRRCSETGTALPSCPVNCLWSTWNKGGCSKTCGKGTLTYTRTKKTVEAHGGTCEGHCKGDCEETKKVKNGCNLQECPALDCDTLEEGWQCYNEKGYYGSDNNPKNLGRTDNAASCRLKCESEWAKQKPIAKDGCCGRKNKWECWWYPKSTTAGKCCEEREEYDFVMSGEAGTCRIINDPDEEVDEGSGGENDSVLKKNSHVDVAFLMDATGSMSSYLKDTTDNIKNTTNS